MTPVDVDEQPNREIGPNATGVRGKSNDSIRQPVLKIVSSTMLEDLEMCLANKTTV